MPETICEVPCPECGGEGEVNNPYYQCRCPTCGGTGAIWEESTPVTPADLEDEPPPIAEGSFWDSKIEALDPAERDRLKATARPFAALKADVMAHRTATSPPKPEADELVRWIRERSSRFRQCGQPQFYSAYFAEQDDKIADRILALQAHLQNSDNLANKAIAANRELQADLARARYSIDAEITAENRSRDLARARERTIEECAALIDLIGRDWENVEQLKFFAAEYLAVSVRALAKPAEKYERK